jgi:MFS superfamily sulfate permease-like transporter
MASEAFPGYERQISGESRLSKKSKRSTVSMGRLSDSRHTTFVILAEEAHLDFTAQSTSDGSLATDIVAASVMAIIEVVNCISVALILRSDKWPDSMLDACYKHVTYGLIIAQVVATSMTGLPGAIISCAFENIAIFSRVLRNVEENMKTESVEAQVATFFVCVSTSCLISSILLLVLSIPRLTQILNYLPDYVRHGTFCAIGILIFQLGFDTFELSMFEAVSWTSGGSWAKWFPAYALGIIVWYVDEYHPSRWLLLGFIAIVTVCFHVTLSMFGVSRSDAAENGFLLGQFPARDFTEFFHLTYGSLDLVDWKEVVRNLPDLCVASLVGPVLNVSINVIVVESMCKVKASYPREFLAHSIGTFLCSCGFGFNAYLAASDTSLMHKAGGRSGRPLYIMCALMFATCVIPPVLPFLSATIPVVLVAALFVFVGMAIAIGEFKDMRTELPPAEYALSLMTCCACLSTSLAKGMVLACLVHAVQQLTTREPPSLADAISAQTGGDAGAKTKGVFSQLGDAPKDFSTTNVRDIQMS